MEVGEANALGVEGIEVRGFDNGVAVGCDFAVALIVGDDEDDVWLDRA